LAQATANGEAGVPTAVTEAESSEIGEAGDHEGNEDEPDDDDDDESSLVDGSDIPELLSEDDNSGNEDEYISE
jgi:hypothetical protein